VPPALPVQQASDAEADVARRHRRESIDSASLPKLAPRLIMICGTDARISDRER
jgi:hypothetical protein